MKVCKHCGGDVLLHIAPNERDPMAWLCRDCSHAIFCGKATLNGRVYRWEFNPRMGPLFSRKKDGECDWYQHSRHKVWQAFQKWYDRKFGKANSESGVSE